MAIGAWGGLTWVGGAEPGTSPTPSPTAASPSPAAGASAGASASTPVEATAEPVVAAALGGAGQGSVTGAAVVDDRAVLVGSGSPSPDGRARPAVWTAATGGGWERRSGELLGVDEEAYDGADVIMTDVAYGDGRVIAVGYERRRATTTPLVWRSSDEGRTWTAIDAPADTPYAGIESVTWWKGRFVAVGVDADRPATWTSTDGASWTPQPSPERSGRFSAVAGKGDRLVAASSNGTRSEFWYADDALDWQRATVPVRVSVADLDANDHLAVAVGATEEDGHAEAVVLVTESGSEWDVDPGSHPLTGADDQQAYGVTVTANRLLVGGRADGHAALWEASIRGDRQASTLTPVPNRLLDVDATVTTLLMTSDRFVAIGRTDEADGTRVSVWEQSSPTPDPSLPVWDQLGRLRPHRVRPVAADTPVGVLLWGGSREAFDATSTAHPSGLLVDPASGWSRQIVAPNLCDADTVRALWSGTGLVVWSVPTPPRERDGCVAAARYDPMTDRWSSIERDFFDRVGDAPVLPTGTELVAWTEGLAFDLQDQTTRTFPPIPDFDPEAARTMFSPPTAHWTGDRIVVLDHGEPLVYDPTTQRWSRGPLPPISGRARASIWTGTELLAVNYEMQAATFDPSIGEWTKQEPLPLRFSECVPELTRASKVTVVGLCTGIALWDGTGRWKLLPRPTPQGRLVGTASHLFEVGNRLLRTELPEPTGDGVHHPRHFPVGVLQLSLPDGWDVAEEPHGGGLAPPTQIAVPLEGPGGQRCTVSADHRMDRVTPQGDPVDLPWRHDGGPLDASAAVDDGTAHIAVTSPQHSTDLTKVSCDDLDDARFVASHLWLPPRG